MEQISSAKISEQDKNRILYEWNDTTTPYPKDKCLHQIFADQVAKFPENIAIRFTNDELTYKELDIRTNQLANHLKTLGVGPEMLVGIFVERSLDMIIGLLGIIKTGAGYLPLDPDIPEERLTFMINDTKASIIITYRHLREKIPPLDATILYPDQQEIVEASKEQPQCTVTQENLAYVMYTSGSTGKPKGIAIAQRGIIRLVCNTNYMQFTSDDIVAQISNAAFDAATWEIWGALCHGATLAGISKSTILEFEQFKSALRTEKITTLFITTALFNQMISFVPDMFQTLRLVLFGGEGADVHWSRKALENSPKELFNVYGPTENTTYSTYYNIENLAKECKNVPIGRAISNTTLYVLDSDLHPVPVNTSGELYLGGDGLARCYFNRPDLTAEKFVPHPFSKIPGARLYKTGDLVHYHADGNVEFLGRVDHQVKIRGFRIELGEIETALVQHSDVKQSIVVVRETSGNKKLVAYLETLAKEETLVSQLRSTLKEQLPHYMVPDLFVLLEQFPLNTNGKIDRKALPELSASSSPASVYTAYSNETTAVIMQIWQNLLGVEDIDISDDFFDLGGNSLLATRLQFEIQNTLNKNISLRDIYTQGNIKAIEETLSQQDENNTSEFLVKLKSGTRLPFFFVPDILGDTASYGAIISYLDEQQAVYGFRPKGFKEGEKPFTSIKEMANFYIEIMRQVQPKGPYMLGGLSMAGTVAFEMAQQLNRQKEQVCLLALLDPDSGFSFNFKMLKSSVKLLRSLWHNVYYMLFRPNKMSRVILQDLLSALELLWQVSLPMDDLMKCNTEEEQFAYILDKLIAAKRLPYYFQVPQVRKISELIGYNVIATLPYRPCNYSGKITFFKPQETGDDFTIVDYKKWQKLAKGSWEVFEFPGNHFTFFIGESAQILGEQLQKCIDQSQDPGSSPG